MQLLRNITATVILAVLIAGIPVIWATAGVGFVLPFVVVFGGMFISAAVNASR